MINWDPNLPKKAVVFVLLNIFSAIFIKTNPFQIQRRRFETLAAW
jgi:hypothetical protein